MTGRIRGSTLSFVTALPVLRDSHRVCAAQKVRTLVCAATPGSDATAPAKSAAKPSRDTLLLVGLGNPGSRFDNTRHNVGFDLVSAFAARHDGLPFRVHKNLHSEHATVRTPAAVVHVLKPTTFMNNSGTAVRAAMRYFRLPPSALLVVVDDIALDVGRLRLRARGSAGGHNGLKSIQNALSSPEYARLKVGVGTPRDTSLWADFVLERFSKHDMKTLQSVEWDVMDILDFWTHEPDLTRVMNKIGMLQGNGGAK